MKRESAWKKNKRREVKNTLGRYLAILAIIALGVGFFAGLKVSKSDMVKTCDTYVAKSKMFDYRLISTLGLTDVDVAYLSQLDGVEAAEGSVSVDFIAVSTDETEKAIKAYSITDDLNILSVTAGRMPTAANECVVDAHKYSENDIGKTIKVSESNTTDTLGKFSFTEYTIVGIANSVCYLNTERGTTNLEGGSLYCFMYIPKDGFSTDYYTDVYVTLTSGGEVFSDKYNSAVSEMEQPLTDALEERANIRYTGLVDDANSKVADAQNEYNSSLSDYQTQKADAEKQLAEAQEKLKNSQSELDKNESELADKEASANSAVAQLNAGIAEIDNKLNDLLNAAYYETLSTQKTLLLQQLDEANAGLDTIAQAKTEIAKGKLEIKQGWTDYYNSKAEADKKFSDAEVKLADGKAKIDDAVAKISKIESPKCFVLNRKTNSGYVSFENDSAIVNGIAKVFPIFFFLVAALVCITTMTRMVEEQRTQIGTLKAIGYKNGAIMWKYISYSGSAAVIGCVLGFWGGSILFPWTIWKAYNMLYNFADIEFIFDWPLAALTLVGALLCSAGATYMACRTELSQMPAELMRPKSPKAGKRVILERIPLIWNHLSFLHKVSIRNIFRYKKRFFMMILGIGGCTALLLTGFGIHDTVSNVVSDQFDSIMKYDYNISFPTAKTEAETNSFKSDTSDILSQCVFVYNGTQDVVCNGGTTKSANIIATDDSDIANLISFHNSKGTVDYPTTLGDVVINEKLAKLADVSVGDEITVKLDDTKTCTFNVSGIVENYVMNYIYMTPETYEAKMGAKCEIKNALATTDLADIHGVSTKLINEHGATSISIIQDTRDRVDKMMNSLNYIVLLVIACAGALAFVVLFNLSNINITERVREIATIKVLGFYPSEVGSYVFRENMVLTAIGALVGLLLGIWLHGFVMSQVNIDLMSFRVHISPLSYVYALVMTFVFTFLVDLIMRRKINVIDMAQSLKSVE